MTRAGRPPKPTAAKAVAGTIRPDRANADEPLPKRGRPACPAWLPKDAKTKWKELVPELDRLGVLTIVDGDVLAAYCLAWHELRRATETLAKEGYTETSTVTGTSKAHPAVSMMRTAWQAIRQFAALLGLDPSSRTRLKVAPRREEADPLEGLINRGKAK